MSRYVYENEFEEFVEHSRARWNLLSERDYRPGKPWSKSRNDSTYLLALQNVKRDEWLNDGNIELWEFLHVGDLPN